MAQYRYIMHDLTTNRNLLELPLFGTWFTRVLCRSGNGTASVKLGMEGYSDEEVLNATEPGRTKLYVERDGVIVWSGIVWTRTWNEQAQTLNMNLQTLESFFYVQYIESPLSYTNVDQRNIVRSLINVMQGKPGGSIALIVPTAFSNNIVRSVDFARYDGWSFGRAIEYMVKYDQGLDYTIESRWSSADIPEDVVLIADVLGRDVNQSKVIFDYPGTVKNYYYPENAAKGAVSMLGFGKGEGEEMKRSSYTHQKLLDAGYPNIQQTFDNKDVSKQSVLDNQTKASAIRFKVPVVTPTIELNPDTFGAWQMGDFVRLTIESRRFPNGFDLTVRAIGWELTPGKKGKQTEELKLIIQEVDDDG